MRVWNVRSKPLKSQRNLLIAMPISPPGWVGTSSLWAKVELGKGSRARIIMKDAKIRTERTIPAILLGFMSLNFLTPDKHDYGDKQDDHCPAID